MTALTAEFEQKLSDIYSHLPYDDSSEMDPLARPGPSPSVISEVHSVMPLHAQ